ncbi:MAG: ABC transporter permease [Clostridia bacterium]|nr:ABC transporter permease [Clostridia bacterium]
MRKIRRGFVWLFMIWKRMFKKPGYVILLLLIALFSGAFSMFAQQSGELVKIAIFADNDVTENIFRESEKNTTVIKYDYFDSEEKALDAVRLQGYDAAWILNGTLEGSAQEFILSGKPMVQIFEREDTVFLRLARERLYATIYPYVSKALYDGFMAENFADADREVTDTYYYSQSEARPIIEIKFNNSEQSVSDLKLLASPVRGILAVAIFLCAYAALMSFKRDRDDGLFARSPESSLVFVEFAYIFISVFNASILALVSMWLTGIFTTFGTELLLMLVYMILCTVFCIVLGELTESIGTLGGVMPILTLVMLVLCPVFINIANIPQIQLLLPPFYYLSAVRNTEFVLYGLVYVLASAVTYVMIRGVKLILLKIKYK